MNLSWWGGYLLGGKRRWVSLFLLVCVIGFTFFLQEGNAESKLDVVEEIMMKDDVEDLGAAADMNFLPNEDDEVGFSSIPEENPTPRHKNLLPLDWSDYMGVLFASVGLMIAAGGGIGGGGILVPLYILILGFSPKYAIPLSNITIFGGAITNTILNIPKRHPDANRPLVDWDLIMIMEPLTIAGAIAGSFINKVLPDWILALCLILLLGATSKRTIQKGIKVYKKESKELELAQVKESELTKVAKEQEEEEEHDETEGLLNESREDVECDTVNAELEKIYEQESRTPMHNVYLLTGMFVVIIAANLLKGGGAFESPLGIECGTFAFWAMTSFIFLWVIAVSLIARQQLITKYKLKEQLNYRSFEGDIAWDEKATIKYPCLCFFAGFFAGMFGVGGGIVKGPLMLEMGVHPMVASATSAVMILYTSFSAATSFVVFGLLRYDYAVMLFFVGIIFTAIGQIGVNYLVKKYKRSSYIIMSIGAVVALSTLMMSLQSLMAFVNGTAGSGGGICSGDGGGH